MVVVAGLVAVAVAVVVAVVAAVVVAVVVTVVSVVVAVVAGFVAGVVAVVVAVAAVVAGFVVVVVAVVVAVANVLPDDFSVAVVLSTDAATVVARLVLRAENLFAVVVVVSMVLPPVVMAVDGMAVFVRPCFLVTEVDCIICVVADGRETNEPMVAAVAFVVETDEFVGISRVAFISHINLLLILHILSNHFPAFLLICTQS